MSSDNRDNILYADFEMDNSNNDMFVITPENNYFNFPGDIYNEEHNDILIIDPKSHIQYIVKFKEQNV